MPSSRLLAILILIIGIVVGLTIISKHRIKEPEFPPFFYVPNKSIEPASKEAPRAQKEIKSEPLPLPKTGIKTVVEVSKTATPEPSPFPSDEDTAEAADPKTIVKKADDLMRGDSISGIYLMNIHTPSWERSLSLKVYGLGRNKMFIRILSPAKEAGIGTLRIDNEMWNYLPDIEKTLKIPPSMMLQPWMGSDFANDDLVKESSIVNDYDHQLVSITSLDNEVAYKIELTPKSSAAVIWGKRIQWIRLEDFVPLKEEYYDDKGELIKILTYSDIGKVSDRTIPRVWTMRSFIKPGFTTTIELKDVEYNLPLQNNIFTLQNLKKIQ